MKSTYGSIGSAPPLPLCGAGACAGYARCLVRKNGGLGDRAPLNFFVILISFHRVCLRGIGIGSQNAPPAKLYHRRACPCGMMIESQIAMPAKPHHRRACPCGMMIESQTATPAKPHHRRACPCGMMIESQTATPAKPHHRRACPCGMMIENQKNATPLPIPPKKGWFRVSFSGYQSPLRGDKPRGGENNPARAAGDRSWL